MLAYLLLVYQDGLRIWEVRYLREPPRIEFDRLTLLCQNVIGGSDLNTSCAYFHAQDLHAKRHNLITDTAKRAAVNVNMGASHLMWGFQVHLG